MDNKGNFLIFCMIFVAGGVFSQNRDAKDPSGYYLYNINPAFKPIAEMTGFAGFPVIDSKKMLPAKFNISKPVFLFKPRSFPVISTDHYMQNFGFFCKKELQFEKASKIPLRFRLGSLPYNDYLEQKPNAVKPY
jgi:hypothetical protein